MGKRHLRLSFILAGGAACIAALSPAAGQQATSTTQQATSATQQGTGSPTTITLGLSSTLRFNDNLGLDVPSLGNTTIFENRLSLGVTTGNPINQLRFNLGGVLRYEDTPNTGTDSGLRDPSASLAFTRNTGNAQIRASADYRSVDLLFFRPLVDTNLDGVIDQSDLIDDTGTREDTRLNLSVQTGINDPLGFIFDVSHRSRNFDDTLDPNLYDWHRNSATVTALLRFDQSTRGRVRVGYIDYSAEDVSLTDRQTTSVSVGVTRQLSPVMTLDADVGITRVEETLNAVPSSTSDEDVTGTVRLSRTLPNGSISGSVTRGFDETGSRTDVFVTRSMTLPAGSLAFSLGASRDSGGDTNAIGSLDYVHNFATSSISASLSRRVTTSTLSREVRTTSANVNYNYTINPVSSISLNVGYADTNELNVATPRDISRGSVGVSYNRALNADWNLSTGYRYVNRRETGLGTADSNSVFVTLRRQFTLKP